MKNYEAIGRGLEVVAPLLEASMKESQNITDNLMKANIQSAYRDGFEAGMSEGKKRQGILTREALGVVQKEFEFDGPSRYFRLQIHCGGYPYDMFTEDDIREDY